MVGTICTESTTAILPVGILSLALAHAYFLVLYLCLIITFLKTTFYVPVVGGETGSTGD